MKRVLSFPPETKLEWKSHDSSIQQRTAIDDARKEKSNQHNHHNSTTSRNGTKDNDQSSSLSSDKKQTSWSSSGGPGSSGFGVMDLLDYEFLLCTTIGCILVKAVWLGYAGDSFLSSGFSNGGWILCWLYHSTKSLQALFPTKSVCVTLTSNKIQNKWYQNTTYQVPKDPNRWRKTWASGRNIYLVGMQTTLEA